MSIKTMRYPLIWTETQFFTPLQRRKYLYLKKKKNFTMCLMGLDADLFLHSNTTYNLYRIMEKKKGTLNNYLNTSL